LIRALAESNCPIAKAIVIPRATGLQATLRAARTGAQGIIVPAWAVD